MLIFKQINGYKHEEKLLPVTLCSQPHRGLAFPNDTNTLILHRLLDSLVVECWHRVREVPGLIPSQGPRHNKYVIKWYQ